MRSRRSTRKLASGHKRTARSLLPNLQSKLAAASTSRKYPGNRPREDSFPPKGPKELYSTELTSPLPSSEKARELAWRPRQPFVHVPNRARHTNSEVCKKSSATARPPRRKRPGETGDNQTCFAHKLACGTRVRRERTPRTILHGKIVSDALQGCPSP